MSGTNINSFAENMSRTITAQTNTLALLEGIMQSLTTNDTFVTYDYKSLKDGSTETYQLPSYLATMNRVKALERSVGNITDGRSSVTLADGTRRRVRVTSLPKTPERITSVSDPTTFSVDANWFFEDLMFPGLSVTIDLTGKIDDTSDRVKIARVILDSNNAAASDFWANNLSSNSYDYVSLKALLAYNGIPYYEDIETVQLPLVSNSVYGEFRITSDPQVIDGNTWYTLDTISYATIDTDGGSQGNNNTLSIGDTLTYADSLFKVKGIDQNTKTVWLGIVSGASFPGEMSTLVFYQDPFRTKAIDVRCGAHEYDIIYVKGINEDFNLLANEWSEPIKFHTDSLVKDDDENMTLASYYSANVVDWGQRWISEAKERNVTAYNGHVPNAPTLSADDLRVVQINTQVNAALDTADLKSTAAEITKTKSQISSLKSTIAAQKTELQTITRASDYNALQEQIQTNTTELDNLEKGYSTMVNAFKTSVSENGAVVENPKYHIRGFFPIPTYKFRDDTMTATEEIIGFDIAYRYICEDNTATQLNTFTYTDTDGTSKVTGTFSDWNVMQTAMKTRVWNGATACYEWRAENVADGTEVNINQIDIAITKGEKVEIKARSISEAGYPANPLRSEWSDSVIVEFPSNLSTTNAMADLVTEINDDATTLTITNILQQMGVNAHLSDTIANTNSLNGIYFKHEAKNIAYEDKNKSLGTITSVSVQDKMDAMYETMQQMASTIATLTNRISELETALDKQEDTAVKQQKLISDLETSLIEVKNSIS